MALTRLVALVAALAVGATACSGGEAAPPVGARRPPTVVEGAEPPRFPAQTLVVVGPDGRRTELCVLVADDAGERAQGLMFVLDLGGYDGMAFVFPEPVTTSFWMRDTPLPLSIAFVGRDGRFVSSADMAPCLEQEDCPLHGAAGPFTLALEVPQGELAGHGAVAGSTLSLAGGCGG